LVLLIVVAAIAAAYMALSLVLSVTFAIGHTETIPQRPTLTITTWSFAKVSLASSAGMAKSEITLSFAGVPQGPYTLFVTVTYDGRRDQQRSYEA